MTDQSTIERPTTIADVREALEAAEQQLADVRAKMRTLEAELSQLGSAAAATLSSEQREAERTRIKDAHRTLATQERDGEAWQNQLKHTIEHYELRASRPRAELKRTQSVLASINERLAALTQQVQAAQGEREVALMHLETAQIAFDGIVVEMPERPRYPAPAKTIMQIGAPTVYQDAAGNPV